MQNTQQTSGQQLRTALKSAKLTQKQLATQYGIPLRTVEDWCTDRRTPGYVLNLLLRCIAMDFPQVTQVLSEPEPTYSFYDKYGKPLPQKLADLIRKEFIAGKVQEQPECSQDFYGETVPTASKRGKLYLCTDPKPSLDLDPEKEIPMGFEFRVIKEV